MPINADTVLGAELPQTTFSWGPDDVILYHLGLGAGGDPTDPRELGYAYESDLRVLPSFGVLPAQGLIRTVLALDGVDVSVSKLLHGEQETILHAPLPISGDVRTTGRVAHLYDKGKAALLVLETDTRSADDDRLLCTNRFSLFFRGEGGWGGDPGPSAVAAAADDVPDHVSRVTTLPQQALLYRLTGDKNPLHADPTFAAKGGFDRPILHGLCTYGIACKALVDSALDGEVDRVAAFKARFAGVLTPGEQLEVSAWYQDGRVVGSARCVDRDAPVLANIVLETRA